MSDLIPFSEMIHVEVIHTEAKIGDSLCVLPLLAQFASMFGQDVHVTGAFAWPVRSLVRHLPIRFGAPEAELLRVPVEIQLAYDYGRMSDRHMCCAISELAGLPAPALPAMLDLAVLPSGLPPGAVLSPFSGSRNPGYKAWPVERWLELTNHLVARGPDPVYVLGTRDDDARPFAARGALPLLGLTLPEVLGILRKATVFVSIDNGLSHLAHFGGVTRHVLLYPALLPGRLMTNPCARVLQDHPERIEPAQVIALSEAVLEQRGAPPERELCCALGRP